MTGGRSTRGWNRAAVAAVIALLLAALVTVGTATSVSADVSVIIENYAFLPRTLTIPVGTTVAWTNHDAVEHTATSDVAGLFDTKSLAKGESGR